MKTAVIGADGQLGSDLVRCLEGRGEPFFPLTYPDFDLNRPEAVRRKLQGLVGCEAVINTAAFNRVDDSEDKPREAFRLNTFAVRELASICAELDLILVHFSTDYVFDGRKGAPYTEEDPPAPLNTYGVSKLAGEFFARAFLDRSLIIRTSGLFGKAGCWGKGYNFVDAMIRMETSGAPIRVIKDQTISPTHSLELAERTLDLLDRRVSGVFHLTNEGRCSWAEFARRIFLLKGSRTEVIPVTSEEFGAKARRPLYSVLENAGAKALGIPLMSHWEEALETYMKIKGYIG
jgi:dTDP-4-dehydrorhamnose reductase